jgi:hypothetical protein
MMTVADAATACPASSIAAAIDFVDELLRVELRTSRRGLPGDVRAVFEALTVELTGARRWRLANLASADAAIEAHAIELAHADEAAGAAETIRSCRSLYGATWRHDLPATAWRCRRFVHLDILAAEHDPAALKVALDRHYPERVTA